MKLDKITNILDEIDIAFNRIRKQADKIEYMDKEDLPENKKQYIRNHLEFLSKNFAGIANLYR